MLKNIEPYAPTNDEFKLLNRLKTDNQGRNDFLQTIRRGDRKTFSNYLDKRPLSTTLHAIDDEGNTPLHLACKYRRIDMIKAIFNFYDNEPYHMRKLVIVKNYKGINCLQMSVNYGHVDVVDYLAYSLRFNFNYYRVVSIKTIRNMLRKLEKKYNEQELFLNENEEKAMLLKKQFPDFGEEISELKVRANIIGDALKKLYDNSAKQTTSLPALEHNISIKHLVKNSGLYSSEIKDSTEQEQKNETNPGPTYL